MNYVNEAVVAQEVGYPYEQLNEVDECAVKGATARPQDDNCATTEENYGDVLVEFVESSDQVNTAHSTRKS